MPKPKTVAKSPSAGHRQRLRKLFLQGDPHALTDEALLELLLTYAIPQKDVQPLARALLAHFGSLTSVLEADVASLCGVKGIAQNTAALLKLAQVIRMQAPQRIATYAEPKPSQLGFFETQEAGVPSNGKGGDPAAVEAGTGPVAATSPGPRYKMQHKQRSELFSQSVLDEAIELLPKLPDSDALSVAVDFLQQHMRYNSAETRRRYVSYITKRMFPDGVVDAAMRTFARAYAGRQELRDVCYYRFCKAEPVMYRVTEEALLPALPSGVLERRQLRQYLAQRYPETDNVENAAKAIAKALQEAAIARVTRTEIQLNYREPLQAALAFIVLSEFEPGMYDLGRLEGHTAIRAMLWNPDRLQSALYELRNSGWLSKISEIDSVRQFTVRWTLDEFVAKLTSEGEGRARR